MSDRLQGAYIQAWVWVSEELLDPDLLNTTTRVQLDKHIIEIARDLFDYGDIEIDGYAEIALQYEDGLLTADER